MTVFYDLFERHAHGPILSHGIARLLRFPAGDPGRGA